VARMYRNQMLRSAARSGGDLAGVFEHDGEAGYFYLYEPFAEEGRAILGALPILSGGEGLDDSAVKVRWDAAETVVGLFIGRELWAAFDGSSGAGYAGDYQAGVLPFLPARVSAALLGR
jgi:hypothetical protein